MASITSIAGGAPRPVFDRLGPVFERRSGHRLNALYDTMSGIAARVTAREALDVLVMPLNLLDAYIADGTVKAASRAALADVALAVAVKAGVPVPDVSTPAALRRALMAARAVVHAPPGATPSGAQSDKAIAALGLRDSVRVTHRAGLAGGVGLIADGEADIGIFPKSEIVNVAGVALAGTLPDELQLVIRYGAGVTAASRAPDAAAAFIAFLAAAENRAVWSACGFDPVAS